MRAVDFQRQLAAADLGVEDDPGHGRVQTLVQQRGDRVKVGTIADIDFQT